MMSVRLLRVGVLLLACGCGAPSAPVDVELSRPFQEWASGFEAGVYLAESKSVDKGFLAYTVTVVGLEGPQAIGPWLEFGDSVRLRVCRLGAAARIDVQIVVPFPVPVHALLLNCDPSEPPATKLDLSTCRVSFNRTRWISDVTGTCDWSDLERVNATLWILVDEDLVFARVALPASESVTRG